MSDAQPSPRPLQEDSAPSKGLSLRRNFSWIFLGNAVYNACQWGIIVVLAKLGSPELVGRYTLALALATPVFMFTNLNLATVLASDARSTFPFRTYLGLRLLCSTIGLVLVAGSILFGRFAAATVAAVSIVAVAKFAESVSDIAYGLMQNQERLDIMARSLIIKGVTSLATFAIVQRTTGDLTASLLSLAAVWGGILLLYDLPRAGAWTSLRAKILPRTLLSLFWFSLPLGVVGALASLGIQLPRYAMEHWRGERELGIFAAITTLGMVARMMTLALSRSALPRLSKQYARGSVESFSRLTAKLVLLGLTVGCAGFLAAAAIGRPILAMVYTPEYAEYNDVFMVTMLYAGLVAAFTFLGTAATAAQSFRPQVGIHILKIMAIAGICAWAVPRWGALGAAWALFLGTLVSSLGYWVLLRRIVKRAPAEGAEESLLGGM